MTERAATEERVFEMPPGASDVAAHLSPRGKKLGLLGLHVMAQPPGRVDVSMRGMMPVLNVQLPCARPAQQHAFRVNGGKATLSEQGGGNFNLFAPLDSLELSCTNADWECLIELDETRLPHLMAEALDGRSLFRDALVAGVDNQLGELARMTVSHLRSGEANRLYVEGLALAMVARSFEVSNGVMPVVEAMGTDPRIARAIDYIEAHLTEDLSLARIARAAAMSPSWFQSAFKATTGQPVFSLCPRAAAGARANPARRPPPVALTDRVCLRVLLPQSHDTALHRSLRGQPERDAMSKTLDVPLHGPPARQLPRQQNEIDLLGLRAIPLEPGGVEIAFSLPSHLINVSFGTITADLAVNSDRMQRTMTADGSSAWFPVGTDCKLRCTNPSWGLLLEVDPTKLDGLMRDAQPGAALPHEYRGYRRSPQAALLSRHLLTHLRLAETDRLYVEGLSLAILACEMEAARTGAMLPGYRAPDADPRIARAIDYIEAHLSDDLSVAAIASAAAMSPSWFQSAFKAATGQPVFAYVRERRLERARILLADRSLSLSQIAYACGFSSHSHMTRLFTARFGVSPNRMR